MFPPNTIETDRLQLRPPRLEDADAIFAKYGRDTEVTRYLAWPPHESIEDTRAFLEVAVDAWRSRRGHLGWVIERRTDAALLGMIGTTVDEHGVAVGYVLAQQHWNQGYMTEALSAVAESAFRDPRIYRVWAICDVDNVASARVMEKAGMQREGTLRRYSLHPNVSDIPRDVHVYALVRDGDQNRNG